MRTALTVVCVACTLVGISGPAHSQVKQYCKAVAEGVRNQYLADTGDLKVTALVAENATCAKDGDGHWRWRYLSVNYLDFMNATNSGNVEGIIKAAEEVRKVTQVTSKMYTSCWSTMLKHAKIVGSVVNDKINQLSMGACER